MRTRDGVRLDADIYRPDADGDFPVLLMRQPYGRAIASTVVYAHPSWYAAHGYIVVIQDVRGRGTSEGDFRPLQDDVDDGADTVAWVRDLPSSTGRVGMYGFSYQAMTQFMALAAAPPGLDALCPAMGAWDVYRQMITDNGAFVQNRMVSWGIQMGGIAAKRAGDKAAYAEFIAATRNIPFDEGLSAFPEVLQRLSRYTHFPQWWENLDKPAFWNEMSPAHRIVDRPISAAVLHVGGWYDAYCPATIAAFLETSHRSKAPQRLVIGPWTHLIWGRRVGSEFGPEASSPIDQQQVLWFDRFLKDVDNGVDRVPPVQLFDLTAKRWRDFAAWPDSTPQTYFLDGDGRAAVSSNGALTTTPAEGADADTLIHDPWRPVPAFGGHNGRPDGMQDRAGVDVRADVACFTTPPLEYEMTLAGEVTLDLYLGSTKPSFDISAVLTRVTPDGRSVPLTQGYATLSADTPRAPFTLSLRSTCATLSVGDALRVAIAGAAFPAYPINPGTGKYPAHAHPIEHEVIDITIRHTPDAPSALFLPVHRSAFTAKAAPGE